MTKRLGVALAMLLLPVSASAQEAAMSPEAVAALAGCWRGSGDVMGKPVTLTLTARPIVEGAMFAVDAQSSAIADPSDRYAAHLLFGDGGKGAIMGFWADSFGGTFTATGTGAALPDGFEITYPYPDAAFVNRWRLHDGELSWTIVAREVTGKETPFAHYALRRAACDAAAR